MMENRKRSLERGMKTMKYLTDAWGVTGISMTERGQAWHLFLKNEIRALQANCSQSYEQLHQSGDLMTEGDRIDISKDVRRTHNIQTEEGVLKLSRILTAYAVRNDRIGYCQGMNAIGAFVLRVFEEENTFWAMCCVIEKILPAYHSRLMDGVQIDLRVLSTLIQTRLPRLYSQLKQVGVDISHFATKWLLGLYIDTLPENVVFRIWDCMLSLLDEETGACRILFAVAISILSQLDSVIIDEVDTGNILTSIQSFENSLHCASKEQAFLQLCLLTSDSISVKEIHELRKKVEKDVAAENRATEQLQGRLNIGYAVNITTPKVSKPSRISMLRRTPSKGTEYEVTFDAGPIGMLVDAEDGGELKVAAFTPLPGGSDGAAKRCGLIAKGDSLLEINQASCQGQSVNTLKERLEIVSQKPYTIKFQQGKSSSKRFSDHRPVQVFTATDELAGVSLMVSPITCPKTTTAATVKRNLSDSENRQIVRSHSWKRSRFFPSTSARIKTGL